MVNAHIQKFMRSFKNEGLTFDDVSLITLYSDVLPYSANLGTSLTRNINLNIPFVSAAMDTVTEAEMAISMARLGGMGIIHKNLPVNEQAAQVARVKHYLNGLIKDPVVFTTETTIEAMLEEKDRKKYSFSGFPIVHGDGRLAGIVTARDIKYVTDYSIKISEIMTPAPLAAPVKTSLQEAFSIMTENKVGKLPIIDKKGILCGLYSFHDVRSLTEDSQPTYNRDNEHRLRVGAAIGPYDDERAEQLVKEGVDVLVIDTAHGHSKGVIETLKELKKLYGDKIDVIAGNIATEEAARDLLKAGADGVKVGIGPGSICTTRVVAGVGVPQVTAIFSVANEIKGEIPVIADGGIKQSGDVAKAIAAGADSVMMGSTLAGTEESPGEKIWRHGRMYVVYRGMGSVEAMKEGKGSRERYGQEEVDSEDKLVPQGVEGFVQYRGSVRDVIHQFSGGIRYSLGYAGSKTISEFQSKARLIKITGAGLKEAHPHDVNISKDAPNYYTD